MSWAITAAVVAGSLSAYKIQQQNKSLVEQQNEAASTARLNMQMEQQKEADLKAQTGMELTQEERKRMAERATMVTKAGESGVAGISPLRNLANSYVQQSFDTGSIVSKEEAQLYASSMSNVSTFLQTKSDINKLQSQKTTGLNALIDIGISAAGGYMAAGGTFGSGGTFTNAATGSVSTTTSNEAASYMMKDMTQAGYTYSSSVVGSKTLGWSLLGSTIKK